MGGSGWKPLQSLRRLRVGEEEILLVHSAGSQKEHKLDPDSRKERRSDNKTMKLSRKKHRRRKGHGRR